MKITPKNLHKLKTNLKDVSCAKRRMKRHLRILEVQEMIEEIEDKKRRKESLMLHGWYRRRLQKSQQDKAMRETLIENGIIPAQPRCPLTGRFLSSEKKS